MSMWLSGVGTALAIATCCLAATLWWRTSRRKPPTGTRGRPAAVICGLMYAGCFWAGVLTGETFDHHGFWVWVIAWTVVFAVLPYAFAVILTPALRALLRAAEELL